MTDISVFSKFDETFFSVLYLIYSLVYIILGSYGLRIYRMEMVIQKVTQVRSVMRNKILILVLTCYMFVLVTIIDSLESSNIHAFGNNTENVIKSINAFGFAASLMCSVFTFTELIFKALALADGGIAATRKKWFTMFEKYSGIIWIIFVLVGLALVLSPTPHKYYLVPVYLSSAITYGWFAHTLRRLSKEEAAKRQKIADKCRQLYWVAVIIAIGFTLESGIEILLSSEEKLITGIILCLWLASYAVVAVMICALLIFMASTADHNLQAVQVQTLPDHVLVASENHYLAHVTQTTDIPITNVDLMTIGMAPSAPRPAWLPMTGVGQTNVDPENWSISLENWILFVGACMDTATWRCLAATKEEGNISMHDINTHFIEPWTRGTGCSVAGLMEENQGPVEMMISHSWTGSVKETLSAMESIILLYFVPKETRIFFCSMSLYQPDDNAASGLSIAEQLAKEPFAIIVNRKPKHGMFIIHTTISEVFERLWCVHEVDECFSAPINIFGAFDVVSWNDNSFNKIITNIYTQNADCQAKDKIMLTNLINSRGGFDRLDGVIKHVRQQLMKDLATAHLFKRIFGIDLSSMERSGEN